MEGETTEDTGDALQVLKQRGASALISGIAPEPAFDVLSAYFLGADDTQTRRDRYFLLFGRDDAIAQHRLERIDESLDCADRQILYSSSDRSAVTYTASHTTGFGWATGTRTTDDLLDQIQDTVHTSLHAKSTDDERTPSEKRTPGEYRLCIDSLTPLIDIYGTDATRAFITAVNDAVYSVNGLSHSILPMQPNHPAVTTLKPEFDVFVPVTTTDGVTKFRFELHDTGRIDPVHDGITTDWQPIDSIT